MDPGTGLVFNSWGPDEPRAPKLSPKSKREIPRSFLDKPHVRHALKYMPDDEQREKALEVALAWKEKFAADKWKPVIAAIETASEEDSLRSSPEDADLRQDHTTAETAERARAVSVAATLAVPQPIPWPASRRIALLRQHTGTILARSRRTPTPTTPRLCRWDVLMTGPVTSLSPMPVGNSFAGGSILEITTPPIEQSEPATPVTAMLLNPDNPFLPCDAEARAAYQNVKDEIDALARKYCMARFNTRASGESSDFLPNTMIKPKDLLEATRMALDARKVKLKEAIIKDLPDRLQRHGAEKTALLGRLCITDESELCEQHDWMNNEALMPVPEVHDKHDYKPPSTRLAVSVLDEQREALRMLRKQLESSYLGLSKMAVEAAWAVQILEDAERLVVAEVYSWRSGVADDDGYSYSNFLRSIKSEMSTSSSSGALSSMVDELSSFDLASIRSRSNTTQTIDSVRSRESRFHRSSITTENHRPARSSESSSGSSHKHRSSSYRRPDLRIVTETIEEIPNSELTPEDREFRRRGPNPADLDYWAEELKKMEKMRADRRRSPTVHRCALRRDHNPSDSVHQGTSSRQNITEDIDPYVSSSGQLHSRFSSSSSSGASIVLQAPPCPSQANPAPSFTSCTNTAETRSTILDHESHQRSLSKGLAKELRRNTSSASLHDSLRQDQHVPSTSGLSVLVKRTTKEEEDHWMEELQRMESRERARQAEERRRTSQRWKGDR
ncbi:hypothetical protein SVAN01_05809 [Stagonosporopsis vannaccii]|nr:hypothetical protein SVAN01_05809 [Stagonosporopsis vannaccii]